MWQMKNDIKLLLANTEYNITELIAKIKCPYCKRGTMEYRGSLGVGICNFCKQEKPLPRILEEARESQREQLEDKYDSEISFIKFPPQGCQGNMIGGLGGLPQDPLWWGFP